jgi:hypothetical protein
MVCTPRALQRRMTPQRAADRLRAAELEYRLAQDEHDRSTSAVIRYWAARRELEIAWMVARAVLSDFE